MVSWQSLCSFALRAPPTNRWLPDTAAHSVAVAMAGCALLATGCSRAEPPLAAPASSGAAKAELFCAPSPEGSLLARLQGAIDADIDWSAPAVPQCLGGTRPQGDGVRLVFKGEVDGAPLLIVIGVANLPRTAAAARNVAANVTLVREGAGAFYSTQGDDKCALDEVQQEPIAGLAGRYRLSARGYCTQPARALGGEGAVLVTRFDVVALVDYPKD